MLITFNLMHDPVVKVKVNPQFVETLVDGTPFAKGVPCCQITMASGTKFFVKETLDEVEHAISIYP